MRLPQAFKVKIFVTIVVALIMDIIYAGTNAQTSPGVQNVNGALFFATMVMGFSAVQNIILIFPSERAVFLREVNNNMYCVSAYFFGKIVSELPTSFIIPFLFSLIIYWAIGFATAFWYNFPLFGKIRIKCLYI